MSVKEVRVFVEGATAATAATAQSPFAIPSSMLAHEALTSEEKAEPALMVVDEVPADAEPVEVVAEPVAQEAEEPAAQEEAADEQEPQQEETEVE